MQGVFKRRSVVAVTIGIIAAIICSLVHIDNLINSVVSTVLTPLGSVASSVNKGINSLEAHFVKASVYESEILKLTDELAKARRNARSGESYRKENDTLRSELNLIDNLDDSYDGIACKVTSYKPNNWFDTITINKGSLSGISVNCPVVNSDGLVGRISKVGLNWARVESVININSAIYARSSVGSIAVVEGDSELSEKKQCKMSFIQESEVFNEGDYVETSGEGEVYPSGLRIGYIKALSNESSGASYGVIEPAVDFDKLNDVVVMVRK